MLVGITSFFLSRVSDSTGRSGIENASFHKIFILRKTDDDAPILHYSDSLSTFTLYSGPAMQSINKLCVGRFNYSAGWWINRVCFSMHPLTFPRIPNCLPLRKSFWETGMADRTALGCCLLHCTSHWVNFACTTGLSTSHRHRRMPPSPLGYCIFGYPALGTRSRWRCRSTMAG